MTPTNLVDNEFSDLTEYLTAPSSQDIERWEAEQAEEWVHIHGAVSTPAPMRDDFGFDVPTAGSGTQSIRKPHLSDLRPKPAVSSEPSLPDATAARESDISAAVEQKMADWRANKLKANPSGPIYVTEEFDARERFREVAEAEHGEPVFSDSIDDLIKDAQENPAVPVLEKMIHVGDRLLIHGYEETLKSFVVMTLADSIATGRPWLGEFLVRRKMTVGIVETEMRNPGLGERLAKMYEGRERPKNLHFLSRRKLKEFRRASTVDGRISIIRRWLEFHKIEVVLIDVISDVFTGNRNPDKEADVSFVFDQLDLIPGVKVWILVRHDAKPREGGNDSNSNNAIRGSSEWKENPDTILHLTKDGRSDAVKLSVGKLRYGRKPKPFSIRYDAKDGTIVPENPVLWLLKDGSMTRELLVRECQHRYHVGESTVDKWLKEVREHLAESNDGHRRVYARKSAPSSALLWRYDEAHDEKP